MILKIVISLIWDKIESFHNMVKKNLMQRIKVRDKGLHSELRFTCKLLSHQMYANLYPTSCKGVKKNYEATSSRKNRSLARELITGAVASVFLGFGSLFLLLSTGVYV
ncbi:hypothetical protein Ancab_017983 [Ancistrocladus abbreviatus]